ncbi:hypothetical protein [Actinoallomurus soli]|uniref:hypothetical protein n=1 Tax=Actinoallomurus soli TaxID=2952535 RepID=UPI0020931A74|nr:hypothetical protein [Actinoallomurus soli]MCO5968788.1 hypothetical protein [Actinoallomurus soli]
MSGPQSRIATLLNSGPDTAVYTAADQAGGAYTYNVAPGGAATATQLGYDSSPDALISVDGHQVAAGDNGLSVDIAPQGPTTVTFTPQDTGLQHGQPVAYTDPAQSAGSASTAQPAAYTTGQPIDQNGSYAPSGATGGDQLTAYPTGLATAAPTGTGQPTSQNGTGLSVADGLTTGASTDTMPVSHGLAAGTSTDTMPVSDGAAAAAPTARTPTNSTQGGSTDDSSIQHLKTPGDHGAQADLAVYGSGKDMLHGVRTDHADGTYTLDFPKGHGNPHDLKLHVTPHADGSLDVEIPKGHGNPHDIKVHVQPDKHVDLNITRDKDGHFKIDAHEHNPDQSQPWSGLQQPAGRQPPGATDPNGRQPGATDPTAQPPGATDPSNPNGQGGTGDGTGGLGDLNLPKAPGKGTGSGMGGGGGGDVPPGPGDSGGGGGGGDTGTGTDRTNPKDKTSTDDTGRDKDKGTGPSDTGVLGVTQDSLDKLNKDIAAGPTQTMEDAHKSAAQINIGYPGLGVVGAVTGLAGTHTEVRDAGAQQFADGHTSLSGWLKNVQSTTSTYGDAEDYANRLAQQPGAQ